MEPVLERVCAICKSDICEEKPDDILKPLTQKGLDTIIRFSKLREDHNITDYLTEKELRIQIHEHCQKWYNNNKRIGSVLSKITAKKLKVETRKSGSKFNVSEECILCLEKISKIHSTLR